jgi:hypothetical protein
MNTILYAIICLSLANFFYKSHANKRKIATNPRYALFVGVWMSLFVLLFFIPSWNILPVNYYLSPLFILTSVVWFAFPMIVRKYGKAPTKRMVPTSGNFLLYFTPNVMFAKYFEILCQQGLFVYVLMVVFQGQSDVHKLFWFFVCNIVLHVSNLLFMEKKETLFFVYWSIPMGIIFGYLLLHGYIFLTGSIHMLFYLVVNGSLWIKRHK